eukprot:TRINITY_DN898_c0_g1_i4.p1 TRINITY_DN898_c0_g1~~TRINITY_DN898_c0_g1_i4.p1  ORF type:complete len:204 (+),score=19.45 TRINITY_DN898_c0_g1_i4:253-864(+)
MMEYMSGGSLFDVLHGALRSKHKLPAVNTIACGLAEGMAFLHSQIPQILHRDLTSANILLDQNSHVKIADFGISRFKLEMGDVTMTYTGNPRWRAPEVTQGLRYGSQVDVYSYGLIIWELISGKVPFYELDAIPASLSATQGKRPEIPRECPPAWCDLITRCWNADPSKRPTFVTVIEVLRGLPIVEVAAGTAAEIGTDSYSK